MQRTNLLRLFTLNSLRNASFLTRRNTIQSKEYQKKHWRSGHKLLCNAQKVFRDGSVQRSGNPNAWSDLMEWSVFHHSTLVNAALACYIRKKHTVPDITSQYLLQLSLNYLNDPSLPVEKKFELAGTAFTPRDGPFASSLYEHIFEERLVAVELGKIEMGDDLYWGTGAYLLIVRFRPSTVNVCYDGVPFWKHFGIDKIHANARPVCRNPIEQLKENLTEGRKMKFCCGRLEGLPTCCCGGWTHQVSGHGPKSLYLRDSIHHKCPVDYLNENDIIGVVLLLRMHFRDETDVLPPFEDENPSESGGR
ncbi:hypothetical protein GSI_07637 [Ganoderma sinense ZZ0214-1]|uniref:Uncharacterized protein n=1 Tax=Ganoderma sinense ZZ0214-1 TaxID=1077348 RepID=A0A2G8S8F5_9APHY|nr:hypothetical protein GSI_07637 [Ganoderma sinense ZZ0214-1]